MRQNAYKISVITPFHNVDLKMFKAARDSALSQSIGFGNIQRIVVLHNCDDQYPTEAPEMFREYDNMLTPALNHDAKTPSSPRNYGMTAQRRPTSHTLTVMTASRPGA